MPELVENVERKPSKLPRRIAIFVAAGLLLALAGTSITAVAAVDTAGAKPNRVTLSFLLEDEVLRVSGRAYRDGRPAANATVTLRAGLMSNSLEAVDNTRTGSDGRFLMEIEKGFLLEVAGRVAASSGGTTRVYLRTTTSFAKSKIKSIVIDATGAG